MNPWAMPFFPSVLHARRLLCTNPYMSSLMDKVNIRNIENANNFGSTAIREDRISCFERDHGVFSPPSAAGRCDVVHGAHI